MLCDWLYLWEHWRMQVDAQRVFSSLITTSEAQLQRQLRQMSTPVKGGTGYITPSSGFISVLSWILTQLSVDVIYVTISRHVHACTYQQYNPVSGLLIKTCRCCWCCWFSHILEELTTKQRDCFSTTKNNCYTIMKNLNWKCGLIARLAALCMCRDTSTKAEQGPWGNFCAQLRSNQRLLPMGHTSVHPSHLEALQNSHYKVQHSQQIAGELCSMALAANLTLMFKLRGG